MEKLTYRQAYDKIIDAYFKDEIKPYSPKFCFCGTLCDNSMDWAKDSYLSVMKGAPHNDFGNYTGFDYMMMERALFCQDGKLVGEFTEEVLFTGMCAALEVLKQIHKDRGENVDNVPVFTKRNLQPAS